jgi:hypothetical protein
VSACRPRWWRRRLEQWAARKRPLPRMRWKGPLSPAAPTVRCLGPRIRGTRHHRSATPRRIPVDSAPASRNGAFPGGSPIRWPCHEPHLGRSLSQNSRSWRSRALRSPSGPGHHLWWRERFLALAGDLRKRLAEPISGICGMARIIHRTGRVTPRPSLVVHQLSTSSSTRMTCSRSLLTAA